MPPLSNQDLGVATNVKRVETLRIRNAELADVDNVIQIVTRAYRATGDDAGWTTESHLLDGQRSDPAEVQEIIEDPDSRLLLALDESGALVGCIMVQHQPPNGAHFGLFAVDPARQGLGTGTFLLNAVEQQARDWGCVWLEMVVLNVRADIKAWYERKGFRPTGKTEEFPYGDERFGNPKRPDLRFDSYRKQL